MSFSKKSLFILCAVICLAPSFAQKTTPKEAFLEKWENSKQYLLEIANSMPEDSFEFKPTEGQMSFQEQLMHIKGNMDWLSNTYFTTNEYKRETIDGPISKEETIALLKEAFDNTKAIIANTSEDSLDETVEFFAGPKSKLQILNLLQDHVTHHRGQIIVYLKLNKIDPPRYSGW